MVHGENASASASITACTEPARRFRNLHGGRIERAFKNFLETFPFFLGAVLFANVFDAHSTWSAWGAQIYFWGRVAFVPVYVAGILWARTLVWTASFAGIVMVLSAVWTST